MSDKFLDKDPKHLLSQIQKSLSLFQSSNKTFLVLNSAGRLRENEFRRAPRACADGAKTLFILDSSYNPPSKAHSALAYAALTGTFGKQQPKPHRLLLLFSTQNADKAAKPASFTQRIAMMSGLMDDLLTELFEKAKVDDVDVDIGVTTSPYYVDKSQAIETCDPPIYKAKPKHVQIIGYDTVTRFFAPKYYSDHTPPLSALEPYFGAGHELLVALRTSSSSENMQDAGSQSKEQQKEYVRTLGEGALEEHGFKREWVKQISLLEGDDLAEAIGVSSTAIRNAVKEEEWATLEKMCTPNVVGWLKQEKPYNEG